MTRPSIGDVLLSHGFVDADTLAAAAHEQERSGQPLGQILVERGAITRLELASALAEQWAEAPTHMPPSAEPVNGSRVAAPDRSLLPADSPLIDDDSYAIRVQAAVSDLARRVGAAEPLLAEVGRRASESVSPEELAASLAEIRSHVDESLDRVSGVESGLEEVSARLGQVTEGIEEAFGEMQAGVAELAERVAATVAAAAQSATREDVEDLRLLLDTRLEELATRIAAEARQLGEAREALAVLAERPVLGPEIEDRVAEVAARLDGVVHADDVALLGAAIEGLEQRLALAADSTALAAVRQDLDQLAARPDPLPELESRFAEIHARLGETAGREELGGFLDALAALGARIDTTADSASLDELRARMEEYGGRGTGDVVRLEAVEALVGDLTARVDSLGTVAASGTNADAIEELRGALEELGRRRHGDEKVVARVEELAAIVGELVARPAADPLLAERVEELAETVEAVTADTAAAELRAAVEALADLSGAGEAAIAGLAGRIDELSVRLESSLAAEFASGLRAEVDQIRLRLETDDASLAELRATLAELGRQPGGDPELEARLALLSARVDELASDAALAGGTDSALEELGVAAVTTRNELATEIAAVSARISALEDIAAPPEADPTVSPEDLAALREEFAEELREGLARRFAEAPASGAPWAEEAARLETRLDALSALVGGGTPAAPADAITPVSRTYAEPDSDTEHELERLRMAIERMSMHLGEQERAIAEVMRSRGVAQRLDELEARLDDVESGAGAGGAPAAVPGAIAPAGGGADARALGRRLDSAEAALEAEREKLFAKLERMASAIDWRLQRLEAASSD